MSDGIGRGPTSGKRSPPRRAEDRDSTVTLRSTRGTGLPPRILSSGRGRGGLGIGRGIARGNGARTWPVVRPQSGSLPPWANRDKGSSQKPNPASTFEGDRHEAERRHRLGQESPTQPKWDRQKSRTPDSRMMPSSSSSGSRNVGASLGYSAGPSHEYWMSPADQAGPSKYSVHEPQEEREAVMDSAVPSPSTSEIRAQADRKTTPQLTGDVNSVHALQDEKDDTHMDTPGAGPSRLHQTLYSAQVKTEKDVKPDLSDMMAEELPIVADEDRQDGVLAVKRELVLQCYEKNQSVRSTARKAFRVQKTTELSAIGRIVQHVLWRDDGVGVQWKKARNWKSPTKVADVTTPAARKPISVEVPPPQRPSTPSLARPIPVERPNTPPLIIEPKSADPTRTIKTPPLSHQPLAPSALTDTTLATDRQEAGPSRMSPVSPILMFPDNEVDLTDQKKQHLPEKEIIEIRKRKAIDEAHGDFANKSPKQSKIEDHIEVTGSTEARILTKAERKAIKKKIEEERLEELALNGPKTGNRLTVRRTQGKKFAKEKARVIKEKRRLKDEKRAKAGESAGIEGVSTSANTISLGKVQGSTNSDRTMGNEKGKAKAKEIVDLSNDSNVAESVRTGTPKGKNKGKAREIVDLTKDPSNDKTRAPSATASAKSTTISSTTSTSAVSSVRPPNPGGPRPVVPPGLAIRPSLPARPPVSGIPAVGSSAPRPIPRAPSTTSARPPVSSSAPFRQSVQDGTATRTSLQARPSPVTALARPPPSMPQVRPPITAPIRPPPPRPMPVRPPPESVGDIGRAAQPPQYHAHAGHSSYSERQALAALARPPAGQPVRPPGTRFTPVVPGRPTAPPRPPTSRPVSSTTHRSATLSSSSLLGGLDMLPLRSATPAIATPRYNELRRALSAKMEEMDNWTSMLSDLPDRAELTQRQIDRTRKECFVLQKQMRDEKDKVKP